MAQINRHEIAFDRLEGGDATARALIALVDEFIMVVTEENAALASGLPSSLSLIANRKNELAVAFERWVKAARTNQYQVTSASLPVRKQFIERLTSFQNAMNENMVRLEAAMEASRCRIESVMTVIRDEVSKAGSYGADGRRSQTGRHGSLRSSFV